jgi:Chaperone of endosialidase
MALTRNVSDFKDSVKAATTTNITLSGGAPNTVDGISLVVNDSILVKSQTNSAENGIYRVTTLGTDSNGTWVRRDDFNDYRLISSGALVFVEQGTLSGNVYYYLAGGLPNVVIGSTAIIWSNLYNLLSTDISSSAYSNSNVAAYLPTYTGNISAGNLSVTGNITTVNYEYVNLTEYANVVYAATVNAQTIGNTGSNLTGTLQTATQTNITSLGTLTSLSVSGTSNVNTLNASSLLATTIGNASSNITGTLQTASQNNITSVGTLTSLAVSGTANFAGTINTNTLQAATIGNTSAAFTGATSSLTGAATAASFTTTGGGQVVGYFTGAIGANGANSGAFTTLTTSSTIAATGIIYASGGVQGSLSGPFNGTIGASTPNTGSFTTLNVSSFGSFNGINAVSVNATNIGNSSSILTGVIATNAQPYITSVGTLGNLSVGYTITSSNVFAGSIGNSTTILTGTSATIAGTVTAATVNALNIGNNGATLVGNVNGTIWGPLNGTIGATIANSATFTNATITTGNLYIPSGTTSPLGSATAGAIVLTNTGGLAVAGNVNIQGTIYSAGVAYFGSGSTTSSLTNPALITKGSGSTYTQVALINASSTGSSDFIAYGDNYPGPSNDHGWGDIGFTGSAFNDPNYTITKPNDAYVFGSAASNSYGGNLVLATDSTGSYNDIVFATGGFLTGNEKMRFVHSLGQLYIETSTSATSTSSGALRVSGGAGIGGNVWSGGSIYMTNGIFWSNGTAYSSGVVGSYSNSNVAAYLPTYTGNITAGNLTTLSGGQANLNTATFVTIAASTIGNSGAAFSGATSSLTGAASAASFTTTGGGQLTGYHTGAIGANTANSGVFTSVATTGGGQVVGYFNGAIGANSANTGAFTSITVSSAGSFNGINSVSVNSQNIGNGGTLIQGTLTSNAQPYITSVGTLTGLTINGAIISPVGSNANINIHADGFGALVTNNTTPIIIGNSNASISSSTGAFIVAGGAGISGNIYSGSGLYTTSGVFWAANGVAYSTGGGSGTPGGANTMIQFNDAGSFNGATFLQYNKTSGNLVSNSTTTSTSATTGAIVVAGGVGIGGNINVNGSSTFVGNVGIGTSTPAYKLDVNGNANISTNLNVGNTVSATDFNNISDISLKENIITITGGINKIMQLNPVSFQWKSNGVKSHGLIAQEVEKIIPEIVVEKEDGVKTVSYLQIISLLISAIKEQQKQIDNINRIINKA